MAKSLRIDFRLLLTGEYESSEDLVTGITNIPIDDTDELTNGTDVNQANRFFADSRSVSNGTPDDIDLDGSLVDQFGETLTFSIIKGIYVRNKSTTAGQILSLGGGSNHFVNWIGAAGDILNVDPDGRFFLWNPSAAGYAVTGSTADILRVTSASGTINYDIILIGVD